MSDETREVYADMKALRTIRRTAFGRPCPECQRLLPRAHPKILEPGGWCRMHSYRDPRPEPTDDEMNAVLIRFGWSVVTPTPPTKD